MFNAAHIMYAFVFQKLRGTTEALYVLTKCNNTRFEFIFTNLVRVYLLSFFFFLCLNLPKAAVGYIVFRHDITFVYFLLRPKPSTLC